MHQAQFEGLVKLGKTRLTGASKPALSLIKLTRYF